MDTRASAPKPQRVIPIAVAPAHDATAAAAMQRRRSAFQIGLFVLFILAPVFDLFRYDLDAEWDVPKVAVAVDTTVPFAFRQAGGEWTVFETPMVFRPSYGLRDARCWFGPLPQGRTSFEVVLASEGAPFEVHVIPSVDDDLRDGLAGVVRRTPVA